MWVSDRQEATGKAAGACFISAHPQYVPPSTLILTPGTVQGRDFWCLLSLRKDGLERKTIFLCGTSKGVIIFTVY